MTGVLNHRRARLGHRKLHVLDVFDRKLETVRYGGRRQAHERNPLGPARNPELDDLRRRVAFDGLIHAKAFIAASSPSKMPNILTSPVMSKIFLICGFVQTKFTDPPCSRTRFRPPMSTPKPVESM